MLTSFLHFASSFCSTYSCAVCVNSSRFPFVHLSKDRRKSRNPEFGTLGIRNSLKHNYMYRESWLFRIDTCLKFRKQLNLSYIMTKILYTYLSNPKRMFQLAKYWTFYKTILERIEYIKTIIVGMWKIIQLNLIFHYMFISNIWYLRYGVDS